MTTRRPTWTRGARRGSTLLEVVLAGVMLSLVAGGVFSSISHTFRADARARHRLAAHEVASRIMLQYLDSPKGLPSPNAPYSDGLYTFRWSLEGDPVRVKGDSERTSAIFDDTQVLRVKVFDGVERPGGQVSEGEQLAEIVRLNNFFLVISRNEDSKNRNLTDEDTLRRMLERARASGSPTGGGAPTRSGPP